MAGNKPIPKSQEELSIKVAIPLWMNEGLAEYLLFVKAFFIVPTDEDDEED